MIYRQSVKVGKYLSNPHTLLLPTPTISSTLSLQPFHNIFPHQSPLYPCTLLLAHNFVVNKPNQQSNESQQFFLKEQQLLNSAPIDQDPYTYKSQRGSSMMYLFGGSLLMLGSWLIYASQQSRSLGFEVDYSNLQKPIIKKPVECKPIQWTLIDMDNNPLSNKQLQDNYYVLCFGYTHSPDQVPSMLLHLASMYRVLRNIPQGLWLRFKVVFMTVDGQRDKPMVMKKYLGQFHQRFIGVGPQKGQENEVEILLKRVGVVVKRLERDDGGYMLDMPMKALVVDSQGDLMYEIDLDKLPHKNAVELLERVGKREKMKKKLEAKVRGIKMEKERMKELVEMDIKKKEMEKDKAV